jgi:hypothetical protein
MIEVVAPQCVCFTIVCNSPQQFNLFWYIIIVLCHQTYLIHTYSVFLTRFISSILIWFTFYTCLCMLVWFTLLVLYKNIVFLVWIKLLSYCHYEWVLICRFITFLPVLLCVFVKCNIQLFLDFIYSYILWLQTLKLHEVMRNLISVSHHPLDRYMAMVMTMG